MTKDDLKFKLGKITQLIYDMGLATSNRYTDYQERLSDSVDNAKDEELVKIGELIDDAYNQLSNFNEIYARLNSKIKSL